MENAPNPSGKVTKNFETWTHLEDGNGSGRTPSPPAPTPVQPPPTQLICSLPPQIQGLWKPCSRCWEWDSTTREDSYKTFWSRRRETSARCWTPSRPDLKPEDHNLTGACGLNTWEIYRPEDILNFFLATMCMSRGRVQNSNFLNLQSKISREMPCTPWKYFLDLHMTIRRIG